MAERLGQCDGTPDNADMDDDELGQALSQFDATLRQVELHAGRGLNVDCEARLDGHRRVLVHLLEADAAVLVTEVVKAAKRALSSDAPATELQEIQVVRLSIERMLARRTAAVERA